MNKDFLKSVMEIPSCSRHCEMMIEFVEEFAKSNGIKCKKDGKGNLYLTKGSPKDFYPFVTSHLDTVHRDQEDKIKNHEKLTLIEQGDVLKADGTGIGADCKAGVAICLDLLARAPSLKCALYVDEEIGMVGSRGSDFSFLDDCAFMIGFDSPEKNRAAYACSGTRICSEKWLDEVAKPICAKHGLTNFRSEPFTDILILRKETHLEGINVGNGGWNPHSRTEYLKMSETIDAADMGLDLVTSIPCDKQWKSEPNQEIPKWSAWRANDHGDSSVSSFRTGKTYQPSFWDDDTDILGGDNDLENDPPEDDDYAVVSVDFDSLRQVNTFKRRVDKYCNVDLEEQGRYSILVDGPYLEVEKAFYWWYDIVVEKQNSFQEFENGKGFKEFMDAVTVL